MKIDGARALLLLAVSAVFALSGRAQEPAGAKLSSTPPAVAAAQPTAHYVPPTGRERLHDYLFDAFGPVSFLRASFSAATLQATNSPPEWEQGAAGFGRRFGSEYGIAVAEKTSSYSLGAILREDTRFYRCGCQGFYPRLRHALVSTLTARKESDGHRVFSIPAIVAPYAGSFTALSWYPARYGPKDAFRAGNYGLAANFGENVAREFFRFLSRKATTDQP